MENSETLTYQLINDYYELFSNYPEYKDIVIKTPYDEFPEISYPLILINEIENTDVNRYYDGKEHIVDVGYQITIFADQTENKDAIENVRYMQTIIRDYMRGERYHALRRIGNTPITKKQDDENIKIGYMRYIGRIDIDTNTIYRRN